VTLQVHLIVKDSADFNNPIFDGAVEQKVTSVPTMPCNMERAEPWHDLVSRSGSGYIGALRELADRPHQSIPVDRSLSRPEILGGPPQDVCEVDFSDSAEANAPLPRDHEMSFACA
jgi:hypothetical protein